MKKVSLLGLILILFMSCEQEQRYFADSDEIKTLKSGVAAYENGDWETWRSHFADTAKIYVNSNEGISVDERLEELKGMAEAMNSYGFDHDDDFVEMVIDQKDETWVYYWATHKGTMKTNKELEIPVHLAMRFVDGKIVAEHIYFDATDLNAEIAAMEAAAAATAEAEMTDDDMAEN